MEPIPCLLHLSCMTDIIVITCLLDLSGLTVNLCAQEVSFLLTANLQLTNMDDSIFTRTIYCLVVILSTITILNDINSTTRDVYCTL